MVIKERIKIDLPNKIQPITLVKIAIKKTIMQISVCSQERNQKTSIGLGKLRIGDWYH